MPSLRDVLERAREVALALPDDSGDRRSALHQVAQAGLSADEPEVVHRVLEEVDSPAHEAHLLAALARWHDHRGGLELARERAQEAVLALGRSGRWRLVLPDWVGPDSARADLCALLVQLGDDRAAAVVGRAVTPKGALQVRTVAALSHLLPAADGWETVCEAVSAIGAPAERCRAVLQVLEPGCPRPRLGPEAPAALALIDAVVGPARPPAPAAALAGARTACRLARVLLEVPALTAAVDAWGRAVSLAHLLPPHDPDAVEVLCAVAADQLQRVGPGPAAVTWQGLLERLGDHPLPPDPPQRGPWAPVLALALRHPALARPLTRIVARHPAVPGAWAHALGLLHLRAGRADRALRVAEVLAEAADRHAEDHESRLLAGLLRAQAGDPDAAWDDLLAALEAAPTETAWLAGTDGPRPGAWWAVEALLEGGATELALLLARLTPDPELRARLLGRCLRALPSGEGAAALAEEAAGAFAEAQAAGRSPAVDATLAALPHALWASGDLDGAEAILGQLVGSLIEAPVPTWLAGAACLHLALAPIGPPGRSIWAPLVDGWERRVDTATLDDQLELLLGWLDTLRRGRRAG